MTPEEAAKLARLRVVAAALLSGANAFLVEENVPMTSLARSKAASKLFARFEIAETRAAEYAAGLVGERKPSADLRPGGRNTFL